MKSITFIALFLIFSTLSAQEWIKIYQFGSTPSPYVTEHITQLQFISTEVGYFSITQHYAGSTPGDARLYKTTNSGIEWSVYYTLHGSQMGMDAWLSYHFFDTQNYFIYDVPYGLCYGKLYQDGTVTDYGFTPYSPYQKMISPDTIIISHFTDDNYIFLLIPSEDELTKLEIDEEYRYAWQTSNVMISHVSFLSGFGAAVGSNSGQKFFYTSNSTFDTWTKDTLDINGSLDKLCFVNNQIGFMICSDYVLFRTENKGEDWQEIILPESLRMIDIQYSDAMVYIAAGDGKVASSEDYGLTWTVEQLETETVINFLSSAGGYAYVIDADGQFFTNNTVVKINDRIEENSIKVFPNPASQELNISDEGYSIDKVFIYTLTGQQVLKSRPVNGTIDISTLQPGMYIVEVMVENTRIRQKLLVQR